MKSREAWVSKVKRRLQRASFKVRRADPKLAVARKRAGRRRDVRLLAAGKASPAGVQRRNSVFDARVKSFRIVDYGGLDEGR